MDIARLPDKNIQLTHAGSRAWTNILTFLAMFLCLHAARAVTFQISDAVEFSKIIDTNAVLTTNVTINTWLEGPVWIPGSNYLVFCDQNNNRLKKLVPPNTVTDFLLPP